MFDVKDEERVKKKRKRLGCNGNGTYKQIGRSLYKKVG